MPRQEGPLSCQGQSRLQDRRIDGWAETDSKVILFREVDMDGKVVVVAGSHAVKQMAKGPGLGL